MRRALLVLLTVLLAAGCSTGNEKADLGGDFQFVSPNGKDVINYEPPEGRGTLRRLSGDSLLEPGKQIGIQDYPGKVVVLNIWGSWCGPCRAEVDDLEQVQKSTGAQGVQILGINIRDNQQAATDFIHDHKLTFPSIYDPPGRSLSGMIGFPRNVVPSTIVLDRQHRVAVIYLRAVRVGELVPAVQKLAAEPPTD
ncbi:TlpA family protein disulfide reductase [Pseudonocardia spinosispora]|uniref:TlpA family protein disulfide reductase n=1 Tax=Pseudonocardia spinosispora TaxID=103441 RepID=UPI0003FB07CE|nr:TlpA disulfide reductase family protein [Pseudonocardia spinosispora]